MTLLKNSIFFLLFTLGLIIGASCEKDGDCSSIFIPEVKVRFFFDTGDIKRRMLVFDSVYALGNDSIFFDQENNPMALYEVPINPFADTTTFIFAGGDPEDSTRIDTITVSYNNLENIVSPLCGVEQRFFDLLVTFTTFDSLVLVKDSLLLINEENIQIFN
ncbi:MAG: DUF6452 family protein [Bacteroidetes bacterium]|nr:DUF6452 family protein [Bacteroidota bacterium]